MCKWVFAGEVIFGTGRLLAPRRYCYAGTSSDGEGDLEIAVASFSGQVPVVDRRWTARLAPWYRWGGLDLGEWSPPDARWRIGSSPEERQCGSR